MYANGNKYNGEWLDGRCRVSACECCIYTYPKKKNTNGNIHNGERLKDRCRASAAYIYTQKENTNGDIYNGQWGRGCTPGADEVNLTYKLNSFC